MRLVYKDWRVAGIRSLFLIPPPSPLSTILYLWPRLTILRTILSSVILPWACPNHVVLWHRRYGLPSLRRQRSPGLMHLINFHASLMTRKASRAIYIVQLPRRTCSALSGHWQSQPRTETLVPLVKAEISSSALIQAIWLVLVQLISDTLY